MKKVENIIIRGFSATPTTMQIGSNREFCHQREENPEYDAFLKKLSVLLKDSDNPDAVLIHRTLNYGGNVFDIIRNVMPVVNDMYNAGYATEECRDFILDGSWKNKQRSLMLIGGTKTGKTSYIENLIHLYNPVADFIALDWKQTDYIKYQDYPNFITVTDQKKMEEIFSRYALRKKEGRRTFIIVENLSLYKDQIPLLLEHLKDDSDVVFLCTNQYADLEVTPLELLKLMKSVVFSCDEKSMEYLFGDAQSEGPAPGEYIILN